MKPVAATAIALACMPLSGCVVDTTSAMLTTCKRLLVDHDAPVTSNFIEDAQDRIASLRKPRNKHLARLQELQDPDAAKLAPELEYCIMQVKQRRR